MQPPRHYLDGNVTALRRGPDRLPRRLTPKAFDELHTSLDHHETTRQWEERFGWDRFKLKERDHLETCRNHAQVEKYRSTNRLNSPLVFRHGGWFKQRLKVSDALHEVFAGRSTPHRFDACGSRVIVCRDKNDSNNYALIGNYCKNRWCQPCGNARSSQLARAYRHHLQGKRIRFVTLTIRGEGEPLGELVDRLYDSFRKLQRTKLWKSTITGGVAFLETKYNHRGRRWHPHLHLLVEGKFIAQAALANAWKSITTDSYIVDVRLAKDTNEATKYITKYATKPALTTIVHDHDLLTEAIRALHGKRMMIRFGTFRKLDLRVESDLADFVPIMSLANLLDGVRTKRCSSMAIFRRVVAPEHPP